MLTHTHAHTRTHRDSAGEVEPLLGHAAPADRGSPSLRKNNEGVSQRRERQPLPNKAVMTAAFLCFLPAANKKKKKEKGKENEETTNPRQTLNSSKP